MRGTLREEDVLMMGLTADAAIRCADRIGDARFVSRRAIASRRGRVALEWGRGETLLSATN